MKTCPGGRLRFEERLGDEIVCLDSERWRLRGDGWEYKLVPACKHFTFPGSRIGSKLRRGSLFRKVGAHLDIVFMCLS